MKIAQVVSTFPPYQGGMGNMAASYALGMARRGHKVEVFCPRFHKIQAEPKFPFKVHRLPPFGKFRNSAFLPQLFTRLDDFDIVDLHYPFYGGAEAVFLRKKFAGERFKLVINYQMDNFGRGIAGAMFRFYAARLSPAILRSGNRIIVTSFDYAAHASISGLFAEKRELFHALPPGIDTARFKPAPKNPSLLKKYRIEERERLVLFVGRLDQAHAFKGVDLLIEAWRDPRVRETRLLIVGQGDKRREYIRLADDLGVSSRVTFADPVDNSQLPDHYSLADLLILPSINSAEAFGIVLIEAMACGVPVLASNLPGVRHVVEEGDNGYVFQTGDRREMAARIKSILADENHRSSLAHNARKSALERYDREIVWNRLERIYLETLNE